MKRLIKKLRSWWNPLTEPVPTFVRGWEALHAGRADVAESIAVELALDDKVARASIAGLRAGIAALNQDMATAKAILSELPDEPETAGLYAEVGDVLLTQKRFEEAEWAYRACLEVNPTDARGGKGLVLVLRHTGEYLQALVVFSRLPRAGDDYFEAARAASEIQVVLGNVQLAIGILENCAALAECPDENALDLLRAYTKSGDSNAAIEFARRWLMLRPAAGLIAHLLGNLLHDAGELVEAESFLQRAVNAVPGNAAALNDLGRVQRTLRKFETALENFQLAVHHDPAFSVARLNLIAELDRSNHLNDALEECQALLNLEPENASAWFWQGKLAERLGDIDVSATAYERAAYLSPETASIWTNLGLVCLRQGNNSKAIACQQRAHAITPLDALVHLNLGIALQSAGDITGALASYARSRELDPSDGITLLHIGIAQLTAGDFANGWEGYEMRWLRETASPREVFVPKWEGESLSGKSLLIWGEQGLGDQIMFASCIPELARESSECVIECDPRLAKLFQRSFPSCSVVPGRTQQDLDAHCAQRELNFHSPTGSLPRWVRRSRNQFPRHSGYLCANPDAQREWRNQLSILPGKLKVGLSWVGGAPLTRKHLRSQALMSWAPFLVQEDVSFISLQYTDCTAELEECRQNLGVNIWHWQHAIDDLDQTAALVSQLDLVISVCTTVVHLAGALGVPTWVMTPATPEWRYLASGPSMPWYPAISLIRQATLLDWSESVEEIRLRLGVQVSATN